ncbi:MAG TPA: TPM domain-containing protein [Terriglobia bacterium]|nr:TPM domain-containing protein [Terriglobia bacterium]
MNRAGRLATKRCKLAILVFLALLTTLTCWLPRARAERLDDLAPLGYVNDFANVLTHETRVQLSNLSVELDDRAHAQLVIVTIHSTGGVPIEQFANEMYERWGIGYKPENRGALILLAVDDRKYRVEVGYGLEPILTDGKVGEFGRQMKPFLAKGDFDHAVLYLTGEVARVIGAERHVALAAQPNVQLDSQSGRFSGLPVALAVLIILILGVGGLFLVAALARRGGLGLGGPGFFAGPWIGGSMGGGFGGFGGGGSFSGFGGGISGGGGATGSW